MIAKNRLKYSIGRKKNSAPGAPIQWEKRYTYKGVTLLRKMVQSGININGNYGAGALYEQYERGLFPRKNSSGLGSVEISANQLIQAYDSDFYTSLLSSINLSTKEVFLDKIHVYVEMT